MARIIMSLALLSSIAAVGLSYQAYASDMNPSDDYMASFVNEACPAPMTEEEMMIEEELIPAAPVKKPVMIMEASEAAPELEQKPLMGSEESIMQDEMTKPAVMMPMPAAMTPGDEGKEEAAEDLSLAS